MYIIIIGAGEVGYNLAKILCNENHDIVLIEHDSRTVKRAQDNLDIKVMIGNGCSFKVLENAGIDKADMIVAVTDKDEVNLIACLIAEQYNVTKKIARVRNKEYSLKNAPINAKKLNIDLLIHPESEVAYAIVNLLKQTAATDIIEFADGKVILIGIKLDDKCNFIGKPIELLALENPQIIFRIVAIQRRDRTIIPGGSDIFMNGDRIYITAEKKCLPELLKITGKENVRIENIMILGGGQIGAEIARQLEDEINIKVIESNADKSAFLADNLHKSLIIKGDGRDINLLALEGIIDMDGFISATGDDETNIISCLMAKHLKVPRIISLINKTDYTPIIPTIGIDAYVSKQLVTIDNILKFIRRGSIISLASIPGIAAEALEIVAGADSRITKKDIRKLEFPKGAILGAVVRKGKIFIPVGISRIKADDKVVVFALPSAIKEIEKLFN